MKPSTQAPGSTRLGVVIIGVMVFFAVILGLTVGTLTSDHASTDRPRVGVTPSPQYTFGCHGQVGVYTRSTTGISTVPFDAGCVTPAP